MCTICKTRTRRMRKVIRIMRGGLTTADDLAAKIGVSPRTVYRYVDELRRNGAPIKGEAGIGYMLREVHHD